MNKYIILVTFIIHLYMNFVIFMLKNQHFGYLIDILTYFQTRVSNRIDTARHRAPDNEVTAKNNEKNIFLLELIEK